MVRASGSERKYVAEAALPVVFTGENIKQDAALSVAKATPYFLQHMKREAH